MFTNQTFQVPQIVLIGFQLYRFTISIFIEVESDVMQIHLLHKQNAKRLIWFKIKYQIMFGGLILASFFLLFLRFLF